MWGHDGKIKLVDFGFATVNHGKTKGETVGTPYYVAPEVLNGKYGAAVGATLVYVRAVATRGRPSRARSPFRRDDPNVWP